MTAVAVRIVGRNLPGRRCGDRDSIHVGVQRGAQVVGLTPGDAAEAIFDIAIDVVAAGGSIPDFRGPFAHGKRGERFLYLSWGQVEPDGRFAMFRRAKLHLSAVDPEEIAHALAAGSTIEGVLDLTDERGGPRCASVRPPRISWRVTSTTNA